LPRGARRLPDACLRELAAADLIVHAGDFTAFDVLERLRDLAPVEAVHGNMDAPDLRALLPETRVVELGGFRLGVVHDPGPRQGRAARLTRRFPGCAAVVYGHTHLPEATTHSGVWILNPGSPTERRRAPAHTTIRLDVSGAGLEPELVEVA
jgi:putative phosphoesterase